MLDGLGEPSFNLCFDDDKNPHKCKKQKHDGFSTVPPELAQSCAYQPRAETPGD